MPAVATRKRYTPAEIDKALTVLILNGGNYQRTEEQLGGPSDTTLAKWREEHATRYAELQQELAPKIADVIAAEAEALAVQIAETERALLAQVAAKAHELDADKAGAALRNLSTSKALQLDKISSPLRGRPSVITESRDSTELLRQLTRAAGITINGTAEEIETPQIAR